MASKPEFKFSVIKRDELPKRLLDAVGQQVFIGVTDKKSSRSPGPGRSGIQPTNAMIAYWMENGMENGTQKIPPRPFLRPAADATMRSGAVKELLAAGLKKTMAGSKTAAKSALDAVGREAVMNVKAIMQEGDFVPLSPTTVENRLKRRKQGMKAGVDPVSLSLRGRALGKQGVADDAPLLDTLQLYDSITYYVRKKGTSGLSGVDFDGTD